MAGEEMFELKVNGMSCDGCVRSVRKILSQQTGLDEVHIQVDLDNGRAMLPAASLNAEKVDKAAEALSSQGFASHRASGHEDAITSH